MLMSYICVIIIKELKHVEKHFLNESLTFKTKYYEGKTKGQ